MNPSILVLRLTFYDPVLRCIFELETFSLILVSGRQKKQLDASFHVLVSLEPMTSMPGWTMGMPGGKVDEDDDLDDGNDGDDEVDEELVVAVDSRHDEEHDSDYHYRL